MFGEGGGLALKHVAAMDFNGNLESQVFKFGSRIFHTIGMFLLVRKNLGDYITRY